MRKIFKNKGKTPKLTPEQEDYFYNLPYNRVLDDIKQERKDKRLARTFYVFIAVMAASLARNLGVVERPNIYVNNQNAIKENLDIMNIDDELFITSKLNKEYLGVIEAHPFKIYEDLMLNKCMHIERVITDGVVNNNENIIANEDVIYGLIGELNECDTRLKELSTRMDAALGVNKNLWCMLKSQREAVLGRVAVLNKNFQTILKNQNNVAMAEEVRKAKRVSEAIFQSTGMVDYEALEYDAEFMTNTENEVNENSDRVGQIFERNFSLQSDDFAYEKALEEALLKKSQEKEEHGVSLPD